MNRPSFVIGAVLSLSAAPVVPCSHNQSRSAPVGGYVNKDGAYLPPPWLRQPVKKEQTVVHHPRARRGTDQDRLGILTGGPQNR